MTMLRCAAVLAWLSVFASGEHRALNYREALDAALERNRREPDNVETYRILAEAHMALGQYTEAERAAQWMLDLKLGRATEDGLVCVARLREIFGDLEGAAEVVHMAIAKLDPAALPKRAALTTYLARLQLHAGRPQIAAGLLRQALELAPGDPDALSVLAAARLAEQNAPEAISLLRQSCTAAPRAVCFYELGKALDRAGQPVESRAAYQEFQRRALKITGQPGNATHQLILYFAATQSTAPEALRLAEREIALRQDIHTIDAYAVALHANGRSAEARAQIRRALDVGTRDPEILEHARRITGK
jgi:tetratricopeptide (TPR) repeat protein